MTYFRILLLCLFVCAGIRFVLLQDSTSPFRWFPPDNFDIIASKMERANPENCVTMSESDLRLPSTALSQLPKYNQILSQQWFANRSKLLHLHNLALNRAFFYSYIQQRLDGPVIDPPFLPSLMYYYLSAAADVSSGPNVINTSAVLMDTNTTYANWYGLKVINHTLPLFGPMARRLDNWNDEMNFLRVPSNNTIKIYDMGAGPNSNYTAPWYKNNPYIRDREMGIEFIPDNRGTAPSKNQYTTKIQLATINGDPIEQLETGKFYGPNAPGMKESFLPVRFTRPYYDCGGTNRWIVSSVSALSDFMPRYSNITRLRGPRMVGIVVQGMDFYRIDFNPCAPGLGNPNHFLAGIARCKPTTLCVPLPGFGFRRGGYECVCQPGHRLPAGQIGPFRGVDIEVASKEEYENGFDCLPVGWREVIPEETGVQGTLERRRRAASTIDVEYFHRLRESDKDKNQSGLLKDTEVSRWNTLMQYGHRFMRSALSAIGIDSSKHLTPHLPTKYGIDGLPEVIMEPGTQLQNATDASKYQKSLLELQPEGVVPGHRSLSHLPTVSWLNETDTHAFPSVSVSGTPNNTDSPRRRNKRQNDVPFYTVGPGTVFVEDAFMEVHRLIAHARSVTSQNCHLMTPEQLIFPSEVSYGAEVQFEMVGRTALRLAHFLSAYYQNNVKGEVYGSLL
ncbi:uncharacterized protein DEA37_0009229, partial [Paragonimus westermani]